MGSKKRSGDTLIEVMFAIAILSLVTVTVVTTMNGGLSSIENALEATMARNAIDAQAEALRYLQSSYIAEQADGTVDKTESNLIATWKKLTKSYISTAEDNDAPESCEEIYADNKSYLKNHNAFVLNMKDFKVDGAYTVRGSDNMAQASTYPRLTYGNNEVLVDEDDGDTFVAEGIYIIGVKDQNSSTVVGDGSINTESSAFYDFYIRACWEGANNNYNSISTVVRLYDPNVEMVSDELNSFSVIYNNNGGTASETINKEYAEARTSTYTFQLKDATNILKKDNISLIGWSSNSEGKCNGVPTYDFGDSISVTGISNVYAIWNCTYSWNYNLSSAISYSKGSRYKQETIKVGYKYSGSSPTNTKVAVPSRESEDMTFFGWKALDNLGNETVYLDKNASSNEFSFRGPKITSVNFSPIYEKNFSIVYNANGGSYAPSAASGIIANDYQVSYTLTTSKPSRSGFAFKGWSTDPNAETATWVKGATICLALPGHGGDGCVETDSNHQITLYAVWGVHNDTITIDLDFPNGDCDAHVEGTKSNGVAFHAYYGSLVQSDIDGTVIAKLNYDRRIMSYYSNDDGPENFVLNTYGGKNYYYYVHNWSSCPLSSAVVTVSSKNNDFESFTMRGSDATNASTYGSSNYRYYWNVFAYKDGVIDTSKNNIESSPNKSY